MATRRRAPEPSTCVFSDCRTWRYTLEHRWDTDQPSYVPRRTAMFVGLNPSTADESSLDPTLRRVKDYCQAWGYGGFVMTNLFAFRSTAPAGMKAAADPIGPDNDTYLDRIAHRDDIALIVAMWGSHGRFKGRDQQVVDLLKDRLTALRVNADGTPAHCLYLPKTLTAEPYGRSPIQPRPTFDSPPLPSLDPIPSDAPPS